MSEALPAVQIITAVLGAGGLLTGAAALWNARVSHRAGVNGDEREARKVEAEQRRDTIADRDGLIDQLQEQMQSVLPRVARLEHDLEDERAYVHVLIEHIYQGAPPPPPPRPVRTA